MELKMTFVIETSIPADAIEMNILKKFDFHNKDDVQAWSPNFTELTDNKRPMFIDIVYDPAIHDFNKICEYISCIEDRQSKVVTHDFNTQSDEGGYHIQFNTTSKKEYEAIQQHCRSLMAGPALSFLQKKFPSDTTSKKEWYDPVITFQCTCCNIIFTRKKSECTVMPLKITATCPNCTGTAVLPIEEYCRQNETL